MTTHTDLEQWLLEGMQQLKPIVVEALQTCSKDRRTPAEHVVASVLPWIKTLPRDEVNRLACLAVTLLMQGTSAVMAERAFRKQ